MLFALRTTACRLLIPAVLILVFSIAAPAWPGSGKPSQYLVAMRSFGVWEPGTRERFDFSVWYPGGSGSLQIPVEKEGWLVAYARQGKVLPGFYPVILLSHDSASSRYANNDIAAFLASGGFIVIAPTHTGDSQNGGQHTYTAAMMRDRPRQLLRALETLLEHPDFSYYLDESRIGLLGVGFGSITVLQMAGAAPDLSVVPDHCARSANPDAFCREWGLRRLSRAAREMPHLERAEGKEIFTPALTLYAPMLTPAKLTQDVLALFETQNQQTEKKRPQTVWHNLFGDKENEEVPHAQPASEARPDPMHTDGLEPFPLELDFQGGPLFGGTTSGSPFIYIAMPDSPEFRAGVGEGPPTAIEYSSPAAETEAAPRVFRRLPDARRIRGIALMTPAGGMLFSQESLSRVRVPVVMIQAGEDDLYPPESHAQPYYNWLPAPPQVLRLDDADHFSLFAPCSEENKEALSELCGKLDPDDREEAIRDRNRFLLNFFQTSVGMPMAPTPPQGYVALPRASQSE